MAYKTTSNKEKIVLKHRTKYRTTKDITNKRYRHKDNKRKADVKQYIQKLTTQKKDRTHGKKKDVKKLIKN